MPDEQSLPYSQSVEELRCPAGVVSVRVEHRGGLAFPGIVHRVDQVQSEVLSQLCNVESPHEGVVARPVKQQQVGLPARRLHEALFAGDGPVAEDPVVLFEELVARSLRSVYRNVRGFGHEAFYPIQYSRPSLVRFIKPRSNISRLNNA